MKHARTPRAGKEDGMQDCTRDAAAQAAVAFRKPYRRWLVLRHGGGSTNSWRNVAEREAVFWTNPYTEDNARTLFARGANSLRQGAIALINPDGEVVDFADTVLRYKPKPKSEPAKARKRRAKRVSRSAQSQPSTKKGTN